MPCFSSKIEEPCSSKSIWTLWKYKLDNFGKYEDALSSTVQFGYHSLLSPLLNIGIITTHDILHYVTKYNNNIASKEGFIRQVIGWREYCYYIYNNYYNKLVISYIGYQSDTIIVNDQNYLSIALKSSVDIDEVTVTYKRNSTEVSLLEPLNSKVMGEKELLK